MVVSEIEETVPGGVKRGLEWKVTKERKGKGRQERRE